MTRPSQKLNACGVQNSARPKCVASSAGPLIEAYDDKHYRMDPPDPIESIKCWFDQQGLRARTSSP